MILITNIRDSLGKSVYELLSREFNPSIIGLFEDKDFKNDEFIKNKNVKSISEYNPKNLKKILFELCPNIVINNYEFVDYSLQNGYKELNWLANYLCVEAIVSYCKVNNAKLIQLSSEYVFSGDKGQYSVDDLPKPNTHFGRAKLAAENLIKVTLSDYAIIRTPMRYGKENSTDSKTFIEILFDKFEKGETIFVADNCFTNPVYNEDLSLAVLKILEGEKQGLYHLGGADYMNFYLIASLIRDIFSYKNEVINDEKEMTKEFRFPFLKKGGLINYKTDIELGIKTCGFESGLIGKLYYQKTKEKPLFPIISDFSKYD